MLNFNTRMNNKNKIFFMNRNLLLFLLLIIVGSSCKKEFLEKKSLVDILEEDFWKTENDANVALNAVYDVLQDRALYSGNINGTPGFPHFDGIGDNCFNVWDYEGPGVFMKNNILPNHSLFGGLWVSSYKGIFRANSFLKYIPIIPAAAMKQTTRDTLIGHAKFLRALFYSNLAIYYKSVPLHLSASSVDSPRAKKVPYAQVSDQVIKDLTEAIQILPNSYPAAKFGYATKGAALGLLARFQLYNKNYQAVVDATATLLTLGYTLHPSYDQLFTEEAELSKEIVFSIRFLQDKISSNGELFSATYNASPKIDNVPMRNLVNEYNCTDGRPITNSPLYNAATPKNNRDPRLAASIYFKDDIFLRDLNRAFTGNTATGFGQRKYIRKESASVIGIGAADVGGQDFYFLRYADVLLMRAEALIELNQLAEAYTLINAVRARVSMPSIQTAEGANRTQDQMRAIVKKERRVELAFEGLRYFDLKRWGELQQAFQRALADNVTGYRPQYVAAKANVFAIPESEILANGAIWQDPAWD
jgi:starch-binding outer membrane protein, SusD/RagB family